MSPSAPLVVQALCTLHDGVRWRMGPWRRTRNKDHPTGHLVPARAAGHLAAFGEMPLRLVMRFTVATYNIHKGFSHLARRMVIHELRDRLHGLSADILFLQEVQGAHRRHGLRYGDWPGKSQHEFIADTVWQEVAYGRNADTRHGHHGNAVLSRFPILTQANQDISAHVFES